MNWRWEDKKSDHDGSLRNKKNGSPARDLHLQIAILKARIKEHIPDIIIIWCLILITICYIFSQIWIIFSG